MQNRQRPVEWYLRIAGIASPYLAVCFGLFVLKNGFVSVLMYHLTLLICSIEINKSKSLKLLASGFHRTLGPLMCLGGLLPAAIIVWLWPIAKLDAVEITGLFEMIHLPKGPFMIFALYACLVNPLLEESFWRGCFSNQSRKPNYVDLLFAGYHALILAAVLKPAFVVAAFVALAGASWLFRNMYRLTGGLLIPLLAHLIADIAIFAAVWKILQRTI